MKRSKRKVFKEPPLQPLRIPAGWKVEWNTFFEVEPKFKSHDQMSWNFGEDMLLITNDWIGITVEMGWYPSNRSPGIFRLVAIRNDQIEKLMGLAWDDPLRELKTGSKKKVVRTVEKWLEWFGNQKPFRKRKS